MSLHASSLADVLGAFRRLDARDDRERRAIARLLGYDLLPAAESAPPPAPPPPPPPTLPPASPHVHAAPPPARASVREGDPVTLVALGDARDELPALPAPLARPGARAAADVPPLFAPGWSRALVSRLVARVAAVGALDLDRAVDAVARRETLLTLPRLRRLVLASEVTVAVDTSGAMAWFHGDGVLLVSLTRAISRAPVAVTWCEGAPTLSAPGDADEDAADHARVAVGPGGRVVALTDLGLASPWTSRDHAPLRRWRSLADALRARGASLVVVTPVAVARIPHDFRRAVPCLQWDRATTPGLAHQLVKAMR
ncbi:MAG: hypothetical protein U0324_00480 [Polyangiales bacterium]